jgi:hypothetical protein
MRATVDHETQIPNAERHVGADSALANGDQLFTVHDAARFLKVSVSWVYEHT